MMRVVGPLTPDILERLEPIFARVDIHRTPQGFALRCQSIAETIAGGPHRDLFLHLAAVALWGAFECDKREAQREPPRAPKLSELNL